LILHVANICGSGQKDVESYKQECEEKSRKSLEFRGKEKKMQRLEQFNEEVKEKEVGHINFELDSLARVDVEEYMKACKRRRRKSLAFRAKEKRRHADWRCLQKEKELEERSRTAHFQSLNAQHTALAMQKERAQAAVDALLSAGCSIKGNPFGDVLHM
jgi:chromosome segregation ATPase